MLAQRNSRDEPRHFCNMVNRTRTGFQEMLRRREALAQQPLCEGGAGLPPEMPGEAAQTHAGVSCKLLEGQRFVQVLDRPVNYCAKLVCAGRRQGLFDVLGLTPVTMRRDHETPRDSIGDLRPMIAAYDMQAAINRGSRPG